MRLGGDLSNIDSYYYDADRIETKLNLNPIELFIFMAPINLGTVGPGNFGSNMTVQ